MSYGMELFSSISQFQCLSFESILLSNIFGRYHGETEELLKSLKLVLEEVTAVSLVLDENLNRLLEDLDAIVREATELMRSWNHMTSKLYFVLQIESAVTRIQSFLLQFCNLVFSLVQSYEKNIVLECTQCCAEKLRIRTYDRTSKIIRESVDMLKETGTTGSEHVMEILVTLQLSTNEELLSEIVALDSQKSIHSRDDNHVKMEYIDQLISLVTHLHDCHVEKYQVLSINNVPIPADFCCPLSLELMSDPVIVASGQTYERAYIKKWLDQGFTVCPKTRQTLSHTNLIPNYTVKALIANWCETNNIKFPDPVKVVKENNYELNIPIFGHPSGNNHVASPKSHSSIIDSHQNARMLNGLYEEMRNDKLLSAQLPPTLVQSTMKSAEGTQSTTSRISFSSSDSKGSAHQQKDSCITVNDHIERESPSTSVRAVANNSQAPKDNIGDASGELTGKPPASSVLRRQSGITPRTVESQSRNPSFLGRPFERFSSRIMASSSMEARPDLSGLESQIRGFIEDLKGGSIANQRSATAELRQLSRHSMENRIVIANCGAISHLVSLLHSSDEEIQVNAVTALLNLSLNDNNKMAIGNADVIDPLIHVLETGNPEARENSAATLFSLSVIEENKIKIGRSGAIVPLVELLGTGTPRGKRDAATALFNLSLFHENKLRIVQAGAMKHLIELMDPAAGMIDKAIAVLANLATIHEGRIAIGNGGGIPVLVEVVELGSSRGKEHAAAALLQLCTNSNRFYSLVLKEGAVPPLVALSQTGTPRAKEKAQSLLSYFRSQRHGNDGRV